MIKYSSGLEGNIPAYLWDIDVNNMSWSEDWGDVVSGMYAPGYRSDRRGWVYDITAKNYNSGQEVTGGDYDFIWFRNIELVYSKINWADEATIDSIDEASAENSVELQGFNENKGWTIGSTLDSQYEGMGYCHVIWLPEDMEENIDKPIDNALDIIKNLTFQEMGLGQGNIDQEKIQESMVALKNSKMAFSINEQKKSKDIIEDICKQTRLTFRYRPRDGFTVLDSLKDEYASNVFDKELNIKDMLSYKYSKTKVEDLCIGGCSVKWGWDYEKEENVSITEEINLSEDMLEQYKLLYGIIEEDNHKLELEAPYISDEASAIEFRNFMFQYYKNQHTIIKCSLTIQQGFELEVGDILKINSTQKVYGALLQDSKTIINQGVYPLFYITSLTKSLDKVDMECVQLHNLSIINTEENENGITR